MRLNLALLFIFTLIWDGAQAQSSVTSIISRPTSSTATSVRSSTTSNVAAVPSSTTSARASTTSTSSNAGGSNTNLTIVFQPITTIYACTSRSFSWVLPADLSSASRATLIDLFITNENIDQIIPSDSGSSSGSLGIGSASAVRSSSGAALSPASSFSSTAIPVSSSSSAVVRPTSVALSSSVVAVRPTTAAVSSIAASSSAAVIRTTAVVARHGRGGDSLAITAQRRRARHLVPRSTPSGSEIIDRNLTVVTASSNQYTYAPVAVGKGRYVIYATAHGDKSKRLGTSAVFSVLDGANPNCLTDTDAGGSEAESASSSVSGGTVAGIVVGAIAGTLLLAFLTFWFWRKKQKKSLWLSQSSRRMFDGESSGWKRGPLGFLGRRGGSKRTSQRSFAVGGFNEHSNSGHSTEPDSAASSAWRSPTGYGGHPVRPSDPGYLGGYGGGEPKGEDEEKRDFGTYRSQRDGQTIELTQLQTQQQDVFGRGDVGLNIPVLNKQPDDRHRLSLGYRPSHGGNALVGTTDTSSPSTAASPNKSWDGQRSPLEVEGEHRHYPDDFTISSQASRQNSSGGASGLQRNASTASTTLGMGAGIGRTISQKRRSSGLPGSTKRKPVPTMDHAGSPSALDTHSPTELGTPFENGQETLAETRPGTPLERVHRQDSQASLGGSSTSGTMRPGLGDADRSRRSSFLLMPDRPLDQD